MENEKLITGDELRTMNLPLKAGKDHLSGSMCITKDELISHYVVDETLLENSNIEIIELSRSRARHHSRQARG